MKMYKRIPLNLEAVQITIGEFSNIAEWCDGNILCEGPSYAGIIFKNKKGKEITAYKDDWILKAGDNDFFIISDERFRHEYTLYTSDT